MLNAVEGHMAKGFNDNYENILEDADEDEATAIQLIPNQYPGRRTPNHDT